MSNYLDWARASLGEVLDQIDEGLDQKYFTVDDHLTMRRMCLRAIKCNRALKRSWGTSLAPGEPERQPKRRCPEPPPTPRTRSNRHNP
jgi:hypothetical protein